MSRRLSLKLRAVALALVVAFFTQELGYAGPIELPSVRLSPLQVITQDPSRFEAPSEFAVMREIHTGQNGTLIIHIQDAHSNLSGQENLAKALDQIMAEYKVSLVLVEGGTRDVTLTPIKEVAPPDVWKKVAKQFLIEGKIAGEEYLNLTSNHPMKLMGIENKDLYMASLSAYGNLAQKRQEILEYLKLIQRSLEKLKTKLYPQELLNYEKQKSRDNSEVNFEELLRLTGAAGMSFSDNFPNLQKLALLKQKEARIDFALANLEQAALIDAIQKRGGGKDLAEHFEKISLMKNNKVSQVAYFQNTLNSAEEKRIDLSRYPNFVLYGKYLKDFSEIDLDQVLSEFQKAETKLYDSRLKTQDSRLVRSVDRYLGLLTVAYNIQMSTEEFSLFKANEPDFATVDYLAFVNRQLAEHGYFDDMVAYKNFCEEGKKSLESFYDSVSQRDFAFIQNTERILKEENQQVAVLISGGYHTPHLKKLFKEKGYSYAVLTPFVTSETNQQKYEKLLLAPTQKNGSGRSLNSPETNLAGLKKKTDGVRKFAADEYLGGQTVRELVMAGERLAGKLGHRRLVPSQNGARLAEGNTLISIIDKSSELQRASKEFMAKVDAVNEISAKLRNLYKEQDRQMGENNTRDAGKDELIKQLVGQLTPRLAEVKAELPVLKTKLEAERENYDEVERKLRSTVSAAIERAQDLLFKYKKIGLAMASIDFTALNKIAEDHRIPGFGDAVAVLLRRRLEAASEEFLAQRTESYVEGQLASHGSNILIVNVQTSVDKLEQLAETFGNIIAEVRREIADPQFIRQTVAKISEEKARDVAEAIKGKVELLAFYFSHTSMQLEGVEAPPEINPLENWQEDEGLRDLMDERLTEKSWAVLQRLGLISPGVPFVAYTKDQTSMIDSWSVDMRSQYYERYDQFLALRRKVLFRAVNFLRIKMTAAEEKHRQLGDATDLEALRPQVSALFEHLLIDAYKKLEERIKEIVTLKRLAERSAVHQQLLEIVESVTRSFKRTLFYDDQAVRDKVKAEIRKVIGWDENLGKQVAAAHYKILQESRASVRPMYEYREEEKLPRPAHIHGFMFQKIKELHRHGFEQFEIALRRVETAIAVPSLEAQVRGLREELPFFSNTARLFRSRYHIYAEQWHRAFISAHLDHRLPLIVQRQFAGEWMRADVSGKLQELRDTLIKIEQGVPETALKTKFQALISCITPGAAVIRSPLSDEILAVIKDNTGQYQLFLVELNNFSDFLKVYPPDKKDSVIHRILLGLHEVARNHAGQEDLSRVPEALIKKIEEIARDFASVPKTKKIVVKGQIERLPVYKSEDYEAVIFAVTHEDQFLMQPDLDQPFAAASLTNEEQRTIRARGRIMTKLSGVVVYGVSLRPEEIDRLEDYFETLKNLTGEAKTQSERSEKTGLVKKAWTIRELNQGARLADSSQEPAKFGYLTEAEQKLILIVTKALTDKKEGLKAARRFWVPGPENALKEGEFSAEVLNSFILAQRNDAGKVLTLLRALLQALYDEKLIDIEKVDVENLVLRKLNLIFTLDLLKNQTLIEMGRGVRYRGHHPETYEKFPILLRGVLNDSIGESVAFDVLKREQSLYVLAMTFYLNEGGLAKKIRRMVNHNVAKKREEKWEPFTFNLQNELGPWVEKAGAFLKQREALEHLMKSLAVEGKSREALKRMDELKWLYENDPPTHAAYKIGQMYEQLGDFSRARQFYREVVRRGEIVGAELLDLEKPISYYEAIVGLFCLGPEPAWYKPTVERLLKRVGPVLRRLGLLPYKSVEETLKESRQATEVSRQRTRGIGNRGINTSVVGSAPNVAANMVNRGYSEEGMESLGLRRSAIDIGQKFMVDLVDNGVDPEAKRRLTTFMLYRLLYGGVIMDHAARQNEKTMDDVIALAENSVEDGLRQADKKYFVRALSKKLTVWQLEWVLELLEKADSRGERALMKSLNLPAAQTLEIFFESRRRLEERKEILSAALLEMQGARPATDLGGPAPRDAGARLAETKMASLIKNLPAPWKNHPYRTPAADEFEKVIRFEEGGGLKEEIQVSSYPNGNWQIILHNAEFHRTEFYLHWEEHLKKLTIRTRKRGDHLYHDEVVLGLTQDPIVGLDFGSSDPEVPPYQNGRLTVTLSDEVREKLNELIISRARWTQGEFPTDEILYRSNYGVDISTVKELNPVEWGGFRFTPYKITEKNGALQRIELWEKKENKKIRLAQPDLFLYSTSTALEKDAKDHGIRGVYIRPSGQDHPGFRGHGFLRELIKLFLQEFPDVRKTSPYAENLVLLDILMRDFGFRAPPWVRPNAYTASHIFAMERDTYELSQEDAVIQQFKRVVLDENFLRTFPDARPLYLGHSLIRLGARLSKVVSATDRPVSVPIEEAWYPGERFKNAKVVDEAVRRGELEPLKDLSTATEPVFKYLRISPAKDKQGRSVVQYPYVTPGMNGLLELILSRWVSELKAQGVLEPQYQLVISSATRDLERIQELVKDTSTYASPRSTHGTGNAVDIWLGWFNYNVKPGGNRDWRKIQVHRDALFKVLNKLSTDGDGEQALNLIYEYPDPSGKPQVAHIARNPSFKLGARLAEKGILSQRVQHFLRIANVSFGQSYNDTKSITGWVKDLVQKDGMDIDAAVLNYKKALRRLALFRKKLIGAKTVQDWYNILDSYFNDAVLARVKERPRDPFPHFIYDKASGIYQKETEGGEAFIYKNVLDTVNLKGRLPGNDRVMRVYRPAENVSKKDTELYVWLMDRLGQSGVPIPKMSAGEIEIFGIGKKPVVFTEWVAGTTVDRMVGYDWVVSDVSRIVKDINRLSTQWGFGEVADVGRNLLDQTAHFPNFIYTEDGRGVVAVDPVAMETVKHLASKLRKARAKVEGARLAADKEFKARVKAMVARGLTYEEAAAWRKSKIEDNVTLPYGIWTSPTTVKNFIFVTLDSIPGFKAAREANDIKTMADLYRQHVISYVPKDRDKFDHVGQLSFFREVGGMAGLWARPRAFLDTNGSPAALLRFALGGLIDLRNPDALDPLEVEKGYWSNPENAKYHILLALDTIPGFKAAREANNIKVMADLYRQHVIRYEPVDKKKYLHRGQQSFFSEVGGLVSYMTYRYTEKRGSPAELVRLVLPDLIDLRNPDALDPLEVEHSYWSDPENAKYHILLALDTIPGFKAAREANDIKTMADLYRQHVIGYEPVDKKKYPHRGQQSFFREVGGLTGLMMKPRKYFSKAGSSAELVRLSIPGLIDDKNPDALRPKEVEYKVSEKFGARLATHHGGQAPSGLPENSWLGQNVPQLAGRNIVEVTMEMALSGELLKKLEEKLKADPSLTDEQRAQEMRKAAMATSVGGIGPLLKERVIAQAQLGANVIGVSFLYGQVWVQKIAEDGSLVLKKEDVTPHLKELFEEAGEVSIEMYDGTPVNVKVWKAPAGAYGKSEAYFFEVPSIKDVTENRAGVVYPGKKDVGTETEQDDVLEKKAEIARFDQSWILGRGTLALLKRLNQKPGILIMSESSSMLAHPKVFRDRFSQDPFFDETLTVFNDHTPLQYAHPSWTLETLKLLNVDSRYYDKLPVWKWDDKLKKWVVDATALMINAADGVYGVAEKHGQVMRLMLLLDQFRDKIQTVTNGVSEAYWPMDEFKDPEKIKAMSNEEILAVKDRRRVELVKILAKRQGLGEEWARKIIEGKNPVGVWTRRVVEYKRLDRFVSVLENDALREKFLTTGIVFVVGGRTHQDDPYGLTQYRRIKEEIKKDPRLGERVIFFENYNIWEAPHLFQGVDFSAMLADDGREASATGFQKAQMNGALIVASHDGAVPESVTFYNGQNEDVANGFQVPFDKNNKEPTVEGFLDALVQFSYVYADKELFGKMVRNALSQAPRVSVDKTAREMLKLFGEWQKHWDEAEKARWRGRELAESILRGAALTPERKSQLWDLLDERVDLHPSWFVWKYKEKAIDEKTLGVSGPGLAGFVNSARFIRSLGTIGRWSLAFHADNNRSRGDIMPYMRDHLLKDLPEIQPLKESLSELIAESETAPSTNAKILLNLQALGMAEGLVGALQPSGARLAERQDSNFLPRGLKFASLWASESQLSSLPHSERELLDELAAFVDRREGLPLEIKLTANENRKTIVTLEDSPEGKALVFSGVDEEGRGFRVGEPYVVSKTRIAEARKRIKARQEENLKHQLEERLKKSEDFKVVEAALERERLDRFAAKRNPMIQTKVDTGIPVVLMYRITDNFAKFPEKLLELFEKDRAFFQSQNKNVYVQFIDEKGQVVNDDLYRSDAVPQDLKNIRRILVGAVTPENIQLAQEKEAGLLPVGILDQVLLGKTSEVPLFANQAMMVLAVNTARIKVLENGELDQAPEELLQLLRELVNPAAKYQVGYSAFKMIRSPLTEHLEALRAIAVWPIKMFNVNEALQVIAKQLLALGAAA